MKFNIDDFTRTYKGTKKFTKESKYFNEFLKDLDNAELQSHIKFANDVLLVPPVETYIKARRDIFNCPMEKTEKLGIGACFGYLFQYGEYASEYGIGSAVTKWVGDLNDESKGITNRTNIKSASYFIKK